MIILFNKYYFPRKPQLASLISIFQDDCYGNPVIAEILSGDFDPSLYFIDEDLH